MGKREGSRRRRTRKRLAMEEGREEEEVAES